jgi:hypothetical protein
MKNFTLFIAFFITTFAIKANCTNAYSSASYALAHAKKAMSSNNFDHQRYYAERALTAFEKTQSLTEDCGCEASAESIYNGIDNLTKAIDPKDWEMGRYYTKKAVANAQDLLVALDLCTSGGRTAIPHDDVSPESKETAATLKNPEELEAQLALKRMAEITMFEFEKSIKELAGLLSCREELNLNQSLLQKTEEELELESLEETREFYRKQTINMQIRALEVLTDCSGSTTADTAGTSKP